MTTTSALTTLAGTIHITNRDRISLTLRIDDIINFDVAEFSEVFIQLRIDIGIQTVGIKLFQSIR